MAQKRKKSWVAVLAVLTAIIGVGVAVGMFLKKKAKKFGEQLDYDGSIYYEDDDYLDEEEDAASEDDASGSISAEDSEDEKADDYSFEDEKSNE